MTCVVKTYRKDPESVLDFGLDWAAPESEGGPWLATGESISTSEWTVPAGLTANSDEFDSTKTKVWIAGGTAGNSYVIENKITTTAGRTDERSLLIIVEER